MKILAFVAALLLLLAAVGLLVVARNTPDAVDFEGVDLDARVKQFLETNAWGDGAPRMSQPWTVRHSTISCSRKDTRGLWKSGPRRGIPPSGLPRHSAKPGGKLITIEIDEGRHRQAVENIKAAGLSDLVDARLGNAHGIVPALEGPFDFVFQ